MIIPFADWKPDLPDFMNMGAVTVKNVLPQPGGYAPFGGLAAQTAALTNYCRGAISTFDTSSNAAVFAGSETKIEKQNSSGWDDVTNTGGAYALATADFWEFAQFGTRVIAVSAAEPPQSFVLGSSAQFADLGGSPPTARSVAIVRDFVVLGRIASNPQRVQWSDINDATNWSSGQSGNQDMPDGGFVQRVIGGDIGYIFQDKAISQMVYVGGSVIFEILGVEDQRGLLAPGAAIKVGPRIYFLATDGFRVMDVGTGQSVSFGTGRFDATVLADINYDYLHRVKAAYDSDNRVIYFSYPSAASSAGTPDKVVVYHPEADKAALLEFSHSLIFPSLTPGYTLEGLDTLSTNIDGTTLLSFDDPAYKGGAAVLGGFNSSNQLGYFGGDTLEGTIETGTFEGIQGMRTYINDMRPLTDASTVTGFVRSKERLDGSLTNDDETTMRDDGYIPQDAAGRYHRIRIKIAAAQTWKYAQGVEIEPIQDGTRLVG